MCPIPSALFYSRMFKSLPGVRYHYFRNKVKRLEKEKEKSFEIKMRSLKKKEKQYPQYLLPEGGYIHRQFGMKIRSFEVPALRDSHIMYKDAVSQYNILR